MHGKWGGLEGHRESWHLVHDASCCFADPTEGKAPAKQTPVAVALLGYNPENNHSTQ